MENIKSIYEAIKISYFNYQVDAMSRVDAGIRCTLVDIDLAVVSLETIDTNARVLVYSIDTASSVHARRRIAFVYINLAIVSSEAIQAETRIRIN